MVNGFEDGNNLKFYIGSTLKKSAKINQTVEEFNQATLYYDLKVKTENGGDNRPQSNRCISVLMIYCSGIQLKMQNLLPNMYL